MTTAIDFVHYAQPPREAGQPTLLLLHGTGGNERSLLPLAEALAPGAGILAPRGKVLEHGMPRFFRRLSEGVFDLPDLHARTHELAAFVETTMASRGVANLIAVGYSNGANIGASLLLQHPTLLQGAILFRPMVPFEPEELPDLTGRGVLITAGEFDQMVPSIQARRLASLLESAGATVSAHLLRADHGLTDADISLARQWLAAS
ncbi:MAG TPA: alpha/beta hydrolase [Chloroflexota bacterium]|jgi:predicted esterase